MGNSRGRVLAGALVLVLVTALATYAATAYVYEHQFSRRLGTLQELAATPGFERLVDVIALVRQHYVEEVDLERLVEGAVTGAVEALGDPYSVYFDVEEFQQFEINLTGEYDGIGVVVTEVDEYVTVQTPFPGSPGATAYPEENDGTMPPGLQPGDRIIEVDGRDVVGVPVDRVAALIRGPRGTEVRLTVRRTLESGEEITLHFRIRRAHIEIPTVQKAEMVTPDIGYLWITSFTPDTPQHVNEALDRLRAQGMKALILDLRYNPGGELGASVRVASRFVPSGPVVHVVRRGGDRQTFSGEGPALGLPLVVLVNRASASASEIVAGAIQDYGTGILVGERTFGKGSVQTVFTLDGNGEAAAGVKITTAKYLTPKGRSIHGVGLTPDVEVTDLPEEQGNPERDPQLRRAMEILQERLGR